MLYEIDIMLWNFNPNATIFFLKNALESRL